MIAFNHHYNRQDKLSKILDEYKIKDTHEFNRLSKELESKYIKNSKKIIK